MHVQNRLLAAIAAVTLATSVPAWGASPPPTEEITVTGVRPNNTTKDTWIEDAYDQYQPLGPHFAKGLLIWNNSVDVNGKGADVPPPKFIEGFAARGWDVIRVQRNWRLGTIESARGFSELLANRASIVQTIVDEVHQATADGYQRVLLAGQGLGAALVLDTAAAVPGVYGVIALAPNIGFAPPKGRIGDIADTYNQTNLEWSLEALQKFKPRRAVVVFPRNDEQVPGLERGTKARAILGARQDLSYVLVDETSKIHGHNGADQLAFLPTAACISYFFDPAFNPRPGELKCASDEIPMALQAIGVKPATGRGWFGYSTVGIESYFELSPDGATATFATGRGALWNQPASLRQYAATKTADSVSFKLDGQREVTGLWRGAGFRMTVEAPDGTRSSIQMVPVN